MLTFFENLSNKFVSLNSIIDKFNLANTQNSPIKAYKYFYQIQRYQKAYNYSKVINLFNEHKFTLSNQDEFWFIFANQLTYDKKSNKDIKIQTIDAFMALIADKQFDQNINNSIANGFIACAIKPLTTYDTHPFEICDTNNSYRIAKNILTILSRREFNLALNILLNNNVDIEKILKNTNDYLINNKDFYQNNANNTISQCVKFLCYESIDSVKCNILQFVEKENLNKSINKPTNNSLKTRL